LLNDSEIPFKIILFLKFISIKFFLLGQFFDSCINKHYEVYFRVKNDLIVDYLIYYTSKIQERTHKKTESNVKNNFFAKVALEFKTPIISILRLIKKIKH